MTTLNLSYKGELYALMLSNGLSSTIADLQAEIERVAGVQQDAQRLFQNRRRIDCSDVSRRLYEVCDNMTPLLLMAGASTAQIENMKATQSAVQREMTIRENRRVVNIWKRNEDIQARDAVSTSYRFHAIEPLENFADKEKAHEILEKLATDRGILAVMAKHKWSVGVLAEMPPDGKVGVDPVCILGLNQNKGQKILLRLRTDDLLGFRKYLSIKKVLFHELSHNVHSEHDNKFYQLMRQVERECSELDWTQSGGSVVGGSPAIVEDDGTTLKNSTGYRLGGGSAQTSRLLTDVPPVPSSQERDVHMTKQKTPSEEQSSVYERQIGSAKEDLEMEDTEAEHKEVWSKQANSSDEVLTTTPGLHVMADEAVATLAMSDREKCIYKAVRHLKIHYSVEAIEKAATLLYKIVSNIISHPNDAKFRSIRKTNRLFEGQVARFPECLDFLRALGFEDQFDKFVLIREDPALLWIGRSTLEVLLPTAA
ncbi:Protein involved in sister chromatid separation and/or segregation [Plasmopara halstedii]|uniref:Protein involved in sister chromatid separation and/or segregation n=1 Tax=Plasmopara halstedii TaxID=4781 RepID=A0A0P1AGM2_PLAHL|nr:Protein involved in sister chromatid separation and/or segregation [Plasmopara halstedii]CEG39608.1 Protein involved in sister chromatid separation and/or segregation [Plasmopara halstedii]|eukprot:XP_024575977.1 Protein involved in sister chromatid separation and/or segregation [Plasmopara halstedii]